MLDTTTTLIKAYYRELKNISVPVYSFYAPIERAGNAYVIIRQFDRRDAHRAGSIDTVQLTIIVNSTKKGNSLNKLNTIAGEIFNKIYPKNNHVISVDGVQNVVQNMIADKTTFLPLGQNIQGQRVILFEHEIYFNNQ